MPRPAPPRKPSRRRLLLRGAFVACLLMAATLASAPALLSTDWGRERALRMINRGLPVQVAARAWRLSWSRPPEMDGLVVTDSTGVELLRAEKVRASRSPLPLLLAEDLGTLRIQSGRLIVPAPAAPAAAPSRPKTAGPSTGVKPAAAPPAQPAPAGPSPAAGWPSRSLRWEIADTQVAVRGADGVVTNLFSRLQLEGGLNGTNTLARWAASADLPLTGGRVRFEGEVLKPGAEPVRRADLHITSNLIVERLPAGPALALLSAFAPVPEGEGVWDADLSAAGTPARGFRWQGRMTGSGVAFARGPLGPDRLQLGEVSLYTRGESGPAGVHSAAFHLTNALARVDVRVEQPGSERQGARLEADVNLAAFARQMPRFFGLKPGVAVENGNLQLEGQMKALEAGAIRLEARARLENFAGSLEGAILSFDKPFLLDLVADLAPGGWKLERLAANTPLGTITASGRPDELQAVLRTTLQDAFREAGKFVDTGAWEPAGDLQAVVHTAASADGGRQVTVDLRSPSLTLLRGGASVLPEAPLALILDLVLDGRQTPLRASLGAQAPFFNGRLVLPAFTPEGLPARVEATGRVQLGELARMLFRADLVAKSPPLKSGELDIQRLVAAWQEGVLEISEADLRAADLAWEEDPKPVPLREVALKGSLRLVPESRSFASTNLVVSADGVQARLDQLATADWSGLPGNLAFHGTLDAALADLADRLRSTKVLDPDIRLGGRVAVEAGLRDGLAAASLVVQDFEYQRGPGLIYRDPQMRLDAWVNLPAPGEEVITLRNARLISGVATAGGRGDFGPGGLDLQGELAYDLARLSQLLNDLGVEDIRMAGRQSSPWKLRVPPKGQGGPFFEVNLGSDSVEGYGLKFDKIRMPFSLSNQVVRLTLESGFEGGQVRVAPFIRLDETSPVLRLDDSRPLLSDVALTPALADRLLARIHPLFKGASLLEGRLSLDLSGFQMPLASDWQTRTTFNGSIRLRGARVAAHGLLRDALEIAKVKEQHLDIGDRDIPFTAREGRVSAQPLAVKIEGVPVTFSGSVGLDTSLRYQAAFVVTETLARAWGLGGDVIPYLLNQELIVPVGGTIAKPLIDRDAFKNRLGGLARNAAERAVKDKAEDALRDLFDRKKKKKEEP